MSIELSAAQQQQLALLKDIDLPQAVSWWPLAPLWWVLFAAIVAAVVTGLCYLRRRRRSTRYLARSELRKLRSAQLSTQQLAAQLSILLHRIAIAQGRVSSGQLSGERWLSYLTQAQVPMPLAVAQCIVAAPYSPEAEASVRREQLLDSADRWIGGNVR